MSIAISTDGLNEDKINKLFNGKLSYDICDMCQMCGKYFGLDMIVTKYEEFDRLCYHCFYLINFNKIKNGLTKNYFKLPPTEYIKKCKSDHDTTKCMQSVTNNSCLLCDSINSTTQNYVNRAINIHI